MNDVSAYTGPMLAVAGVVLQFLVRQFKNLSEGAYWAMTAALCSCVYALTTPDPLAGGWQYSAIRFALWMSGAVLAVRGGSSATDALAKKATENDPSNVGKFLIPVTNSK